MDIDEQNSTDDVFGDNIHLCSKTVDDAFLAGEAVQAFANRRHLARTMNEYKSEIQKVDAVLAPLLYRMKCRLSHLGRSGRWHAWLKQNKIERSCADRLVLSYAESLGRRYELSSRYIPEPLEANISLAAHRASGRVEKKLTSTRSRMQFLYCLAGLLDLSVDWDRDSVRLGPPAPCDLSDAEICRVPNVIELLEDGTARPIDYELQDEDWADFPL
jgi:hypothetical protein